jgi:hypothetical protein
MLAKRETKAIHSVLFFVTAFSMMVVGCQGTDSPGSPNGDIGEMRIQLAQVPSDVSCLQITVAGLSRTVVKPIAVTSGASTASIALTGLPLGKVTVSAEAFGEQCLALTTTSVPVLFSDPTDASIVQGTVTQLSLVLKRNGQMTVSVDFGNEPACSANGTVCLAAAECCSGVCSAGVCTTPCTPTDLALNLSGSGYPSPLESDQGWGGGSYPWDILDGKTSYTDTWAHGLAFTGGILGYAGETCGRRQATVDFGTPRTFNRLLAWHHAAEHVPTSYHVEYWDGSAWLNAGGTSAHRTDLADYASGSGSEPTENLFPTVTASKVRFVIDSNCDITHGWLYEVQVFSACSP